MERNLTQGITEYWLRLPLKYKEKLSQVRVWKTLRMTIDEDDIWVRGILPQQLNSEEIRSIPFKKIYFQYENALFLLGGNVPEERLKTAWIWSPINKAFPAKPPNYNFNYFGVHEKIEFNLISSSTERAAKAQLVELATLDVIIPTMPAVRLQPITWAILDKKALLIGTPLLSIPGKTFWQQQQFLVPTGFDFEYPELSSYFSKLILQNSNDYIVLNTDNSYFTLPKDTLKKLTISGYRLSR